MANSLDLSELGTPGSFISASTPAAFTLESILQPLQANPSWDPSTFNRFFPELRVWDNHYFSYPAVSAQEGWREGRVTEEFAWNSL